MFLRMDRGIMFSKDPVSVIASEFDVLEAGWYVQQSVIAVWQPSRVAFEEG